MTAPKWHTPSALICPVPGKLPPLAVFNPQCRNSIVAVGRDPTPISLSCLAASPSARACRPDRFVLKVGGNVWVCSRTAATRPEQTVRGIFGDPKARVITLKRRSKKRPAAVVVASDGLVRPQRSRGTSNSRNTRVSPHDRSRMRESLRLRTSRASYLERTIAAAGRCQSSSAVISAKGSRMTSGGCDASHQTGWTGLVSSRPKARCRLLACVPPPLHA
jgi:hypothetical protein